MTCSSSVGLVIRCNITPRHSSKVSSKDKLSVVILMYGDMVGRTGDLSPVSPAVATPLSLTTDQRFTRMELKLTKTHTNVMLTDVL